MQFELNFLQCNTTLSDIHTPVEFPSTRNVVTNSLNNNCCRQLECCPLMWCITKAFLVLRAYVPTQNLSSLKSQQQKWNSISTQKPPRRPNWLQQPKVDHNSNTTQFLCFTFNLLRVTRFAWIAHSIESSNKWTKKSSAACKNEEIGKSYWLYAYK